MNDPSPRSAWNWFEQTSQTRLFQCAAVVLLVGFYLFSQPVSRFESDDGYYYALIAEQCALLQHCEVSDGLDSRSILYHAVNRILFVLLDATGIALSGFSMLVLISAVCAAFTWLLFARLLQRGLHLDSATSWLAAGCLGFSYGFWRYAGEAELYIPSIFLTLVVLNLYVDAEIRGDDRWVSMIPAGVTAGLCVLFYRANVIPLFLAIPALFISRRRFRHFFVYGAAGTTAVVAGLVGGFLLSHQADLTLNSLLGFIFRRSGEFPGITALLDNPTAPILRILHNIGSTFWVFAFDPVFETMQRMLPHLNFDEEAFAARNFRPLVFLPVLILPVFMVSLLVCLASAFRHRAGTSSNGLIKYFFASFSLQAIIVICLSPGGREPWIGTLLPLMALFAYFVLGPSFQNGKTRGPIVLVGSFLLYNYFGGMGILQDRQGDYYSAKTSWLSGNATSRDLVLMSGSTWSFLNYLRYVVGVKSIVVTTSDISPNSPLQTLGPQRIRDEIQGVFQNGGRLFVFGEFLNPTQRLARKSKPLFNLTKEMALQFKARARLVDTGRIGQTYEIRRPMP